MPRLYLFRITKLNVGVGRRVAIITKEDKDPELSKINQGTITNYFDAQKLPSDGVDYKGSIEVSLDTYNKIIEKIEKTGKNPILKLINEGSKFNLSINGESMFIAGVYSQNRNFIEYPFVFIK